MNDQPAHRPDHVDELARIKGIKDARQQLLRDKLGIRTFHDLANASPEVILSLFRAENHPVSLSSVEAWIREAAQLAPTSVPPVPAPLPTAPRGEDWHAFALFVVEFQERTSTDGVVERRTKVHHMETDQDSVWEGMDCQSVSVWMAGELHDHIETSPVATQQPPVTPVTDSPQLGLTTFNERLERLLATVQHLTPADSSTQPAPAIMAKETAQVAPPAAALPQPAGDFSPTLSQLIQRIETKGRKPVGVVPAPPITLLPPPDAAFSPALQRLLERYRHMGTL